MKRVFMPKLFLAFLAVYFSFVGCVAVNAAGNGWIGTSEGADTGSGGGTGGGVARKSYSWIYYQSQIDYPLEMRFAPINTATDGITISGYKTISETCSNGTNRGFWHLGTNAQSYDKDKNAKYTGYYAFDSGANIYTLGFPQLKSISSYNPLRITLQWPKYGYASTMGGLYGHSDTRNVQTFWNWDITRPGNASYGWYKQWALPESVLLFKKNGKVENWGHGLYYDGKLIYMAVRSGSSSEVVNDFKKAYKAATGTDYAGSSLPSDVFAFCYWDDIDEEYTLTAKAVDIAGESLDAVISDRTRKVTAGNVASVERRVNANYEFYCWRSTANGNCITSTDTNSDLFVSGTGGIKINKKMTADATVYAVYSIKDVVLNAYAIEVNSSGGYLADLNNGNTFDSMKVNYNADASVKSSKFKPSGYTFRGWRDNKSSGALQNQEEYKVTSMTSNKDVFAGYERNAFEGRARVFAGDSTSGNTYKSVGYIGKSGSELLEIPCDNNGCNVTFDFALKTRVGAGETSYSIQRKINSDNYTDVSSTAPVSPFAPSASGGIITINGSESITVKLAPGNTYCYRLSFKPYGTSNDSEYANLDVCVNAKATKFYGVTSVKKSGGGILSTTNWQNVTKSNRLQLSGCSPVDGCEIKFEHKLKSDPNHGGSTGYTVKRASNAVSNSLGDRKIASGDMKNDTFSGSETTVFESDTLKVYPGMLICETLSFRQSNAATTTIFTRVCVSVVGDAQPPDSSTPEPDDPDNPSFPEDSNEDSENGTFVDIEVKNNDGIDRYKTYQNVVYAKPGDNLTFRTVYNPVLQYTYHLVPELMQKDGGSTIQSNGAALGVLFNTTIGGTIYDWKNSVGVNSNRFSVSYSKDHPYTIGDSTKRLETNDHVVTSGEVGLKDLYETARTNNLSRTTPGQVNFWDNDSKLIANVSTAARSDKAYVRVPYSYNTNTKILSSEEESFVYAGEDASSIKYEVNVLKKNNSLTTNGSDEQAYATKVENAMIKAIFYTSESGSIISGNSSFGSKDSNICEFFNSFDGCKVVEQENNIKLNESGSKEGETKTLTLKNGKVFVPDVDAGAYFCIAMAIYPSNSGADHNLNASGNDRWYISDSKCFKVAKKPNFQLWGGGIIMSGNEAGANLFVSEKKNLDGFAEASSDSSTYVFGSFVEDNLIANGVVKGLASGAGTGYTERGLVANPGGSKEGAKADYCMRSMLSISNADCNNSRQYVGGASLSSLSKNVSEKTVLVEKLFPGMEANITAESVDLNADYNETSAGVRFSYSKNNLTIGAATISKGVTHVVRSDKDILISGNLIYDDGYTELEQIPKLIIFANNIKVNCDVANVVNRIDAVLIAKENVDTCSATDGDKGAVTGIDSEANSKQLKINGMILANSLTLNRTYGAARGVRSIVPAEIINYDTSLYLWSFGGKADPENTGKFTQTYLKELPPRY